jgi:hypothetical protein
MPTQRLEYAAVPEYERFLRQRKSSLSSRSRSLMTFGKRSVTMTPIEKHLQQWRTAP